MSKQHTLKVYVGGEVFDDLATTSAMMITMHELLIPLAIIPLASRHSVEKNYSSKICVDND